MNNLARISEQRDFAVSSSSLKDVRSFSREVFEKVNIDQDLKDELVLAIAEAAQNIVKHAYEGEDTEDKMEIKMKVGAAIVMALGMVIAVSLLGVQADHRRMSEVGRSAQTRGLCRPSDRSVALRRVRQCMSSRMCDGDVCGHRGGRA